MLTIYALAGLLAYGYLMSWLIGKAGVKVLEVLARANQLWYDRDNKGMKGFDSEL